MLRGAIVGGSIGGLATARVFHRLGASVRVFEKSPTSFEGRGGVRARHHARCHAWARLWRRGFHLVIL